MPPVPPEMARVVHGDYVLLVISFRKLSRLGLILLLMVTAFRQASDRRLVLQLLDREHPHRG